MELKDKRITIVMPVYNEGSSIEKNIREIEEKIMKKLPNVTLLIAEDGSTDNTKEVLNRLQQNVSGIKVNMSSNRKGYPKAVVDAILSVDDNTDFILFMDSDGQYDPIDFEKLRAEMENHTSDIVMGMRLNRTESLYRKVLSKGLRTLEKFLFDLKCNDITSAFRLMKYSIAKDLAKNIKYSKYNFWSEFTARAGLEGYTIKEVPVQYREREGESRVYSMRKMPKVVLNEFSAIVQTWLEKKFREVLKFALVGASGAAIILGLMALLTEKFEIFYPISAGIGIETSIVWAFILHDKWTFKDIIIKQHGFVLSRFLRYNLISLGGMAINESVLVSLTSMLKINYIASEAIAIIVAFGFNYFINRKITWKRKQAQLESIT